MLSMGVYEMSLQEKIQFLIFKSVTRIFDMLSLHSILAHLYKRFVFHIDPDMSLSRFVPTRNLEKLTVLVLSREHFRGDIQMLASREDIECLDLSTQFQRFLLACFVREPSREEEQASEWGIRTDFRMAKPGSEIYERRKQYRAFLRKLLPYFLNQLGVDIVINSDERWRRQADLTRVATELGFPHIGIERESMFLSDALYYGSIERHKRLGHFHGYKLAVQNEKVKDVFIESGYAKEEQILISGCLRMDSFLRQLGGKAEPSLNSRKMVLMFTWQNNKRLQDGTLFEAFDATEASVRALTRLAMKRPDVDFIIKLKDVHLGANVRASDSSKGQRELLQDTINEVSGSQTGLPNIKFSHERFVPTELLMNATVVCSMQSTTVLEAGIAGKPVVLPHFKFLRERHGADEYLFYRDCYSLFDVPDDEYEMERMVAARLDEPVVDEGATRQMMDMFNRYVSPVDGLATERLVAFFKDIKGKKTALVSSRR